MTRLMRFIAAGASCALVALVATPARPAPVQASAGSAGAADIAMDAARPCFYFYQGSAKALELDPTRIVIRLREGAAEPAAAALQSAARVAVERATPTGLPRWMMLDVSAPATGGRATEAVGDGRALRPADAARQVGSTLASLLSDPSIEFASPVFRGLDGGWVAVTPELLIGLRPGARSGADAFLGEIASAAFVADARFGDLPGAYRLHCVARDGFEVLALANRLAQDPRVAWAEPNMQFTGRHMDAPADPVAALFPNDPEFSYLWGLYNNGDLGGTPGIDVGASAAWDLTTGRPGVKVLILDVGVQQDHPDLNLGRGADFTHNGDAYDGGPGNSCDSHGTAVAGCVSAIINNGLGVVGVAPNCPVLSARVGVSDVSCEFWTGQTDATVYALAWGLVRGARVSNNSNGYGFTSNAIDAAYASTRDGGMVHFSSAGNGGQQPLGYPASLPTVMAVAAINLYGALTSWSNYGPDVEFCAPGDNILTTDRTGSAGWVAGDYVWTAGTSFSSPYAAGVAALIISKDTTLTAPMVEDLMKLGCQDLGATGFDPVFSWGMVNAYNSLGLVQASPLAVGAAPARVTFKPGRPNPFVNRAELGFSLAVPGRVTLEVFDARGRRVRVLADGDFAAGAYSIPWDGRGAGGGPAAAGIYFCRLRAAGASSVQKLVRLGGPIE